MPRAAVEALPVMAARGRFARAPPTTVPGAVRLPDDHSREAAPSPNSQLKNRRATVAHGPHAVAEGLSARANTRVQCRYYDSTKTLGTELQRELYSTWVSREILAVATVTFDTTLFVSKRAE